MTPTAILAALAEPNRLRIVELLHAAPRAVGEVAAETGLRQPQATKHLQALERAGLVTVHPLGRRRIYALRRDGLRELRTWLEGFEGDHPSESVVEEYRRAIARETGAERTFTLARSLPGPPREVWRHWTEPNLVRTWWAPDHFTVAESELDPVPGGRMRIVLQEGDGTRHDSAGRFRTLDAPVRLGFDLAPLAPNGAPLFDAAYDVTLTGQDATELALTIAVTNVRPGAEPALAGIEIGWRQLLANLARELS